MTEISFLIFSLLSLLHLSILIVLLDIEVPFKLLPSTDTRFEFNPSTGRLGIGEMMPIEITFKPDTLGDFSSVFEWSLAVCFYYLFLSLLSLYLLSL